MLSELTIGIPIYNEETTLKESMLSIMTSAENIDKSYEIVTCFNGTTDNGREIIEDLSKEKPIKIIESKKGKPQAIRKIVSESSSQYLIFCDADLIVEKDCFKNLLDCFKEKTKVVTGCPQPWAKNSLVYKIVNARMLDPELKIDEIKINFPAISKEEYEKITGLDYDITLNNVKYLVSEAKRRNFSGRYRIIIVSEEETQNEIDFWRSLGIESKLYPKLNRGGSIKTKAEVKQAINGCKYDREKEWMHISSNGEIILCCMDWNRKHILGDITKESIEKIWNSHKYKELRKKIEHSEEISFICNICEWGLSTVKDAYDNK